MARRTLARSVGLPVMPSFLCRTLVLVRTAPAFWGAAQLRPDSRAAGLKKVGRDSETWGQTAGFGRFGRVTKPVLGSLGLFLGLWGLIACPSLFSA